MSTDFFDKQYKAKRNSAFLYSMFMFTIVAFVGSIMFFVSWFIAEPTFLDKFFHRYTLTAGLIAFLVYLTGCFIEWRRLAGGGKAIARRIHAKPLYKIHARDAYGAETQDDSDNFTTQEKQLLEIVTHMSISSGVPTPHVFVLPNERGINAFVAGTKENDIVLVITQGATETLSEPELYALIAHEFSHIAHGDTHQNMKLLILMGGFQVFYDIGVELMDDEDYQHMRNHQYKQYNTPTKNDDNATMFNAISALGLLILIFGSVGILFARLFKFAFLRQREYLADASSIQYTRSNALLDVLEKVRDMPQHGALYHHHVESYSHMFFANAIPSSNLFGSVLASHPPIEKRIKKISKQRYHYIKKQENYQADKQARELSRKNSLPNKHRTSAQAVKSIRQENYFQYREKSDYDGTPVEFKRADDIPTGVIAETTKQSTTSKNLAENQAPSSAESLNVIPALNPLSKAKSLKVEEVNADLIDPLVDAMATPRGCLELIAAALAIHQQTAISPLDYEVSVKLYKLLKTKSREQDISRIIQALDMLANKRFKIDSKAAQLYISRLQNIIQIDGEQSLLEQLLLDRIAFQLGLVPICETTKNCSNEQIAFAFTLLANAFLKNDNHNNEERQQILSRMQHLINLEQSVWQNITPEALSLSDCLTRFAMQPQPVKRNILETIETVMLADGNFCDEEKHMLHLLNWRLSI